MIYDSDLVTINGVTVPSIKSYKIGRAKLWKNADRNMNGTVKAYLIGIFPKIEIQVGYLNQEDMATLVQLLDQDFFTVTWFDVRIQTTVSTQYYAADYDIELEDKHRGLYKPFTVSLVPVEKRRY